MAITASKIWNCTWCLRDEYLSLPFFNYCKNYLHEQNNGRNTLYSVLKYKQDLGRLSSSTERFGDFLDDLIEFPKTTYQLYEFIPYEDSVLCKAEIEEKHYEQKLFQTLFQYQLRAIYDIPEIMTIGEVRAKLLDPALDKIIAHPTILANIWFINRISTEQVSIEIFLFSPAAIDELELANIVASELLSRCSSRRIDPKDCYYWFYRYYCEIFLNENLFTQSFGILNCVVKTENSAIDMLTTSACPPVWDSTLSYIFDYKFCSPLDNWMGGLSRAVRAHTLAQSGPNSTSFDFSYCILLSSEWSEANRANTRFRPIHKND